MKKLFFVILMLPGLAFAEDTYSSFKELSQHEVQGRDFQIEVREQKSPNVILAIHGGRIEFATDLIARAIAGANNSYYLFLATKDKNNSTLHITSTHFDEPQALSLVSKTPTCVSIHGYKERHLSDIIVGGANTELRMKVKQHLIDANFKISQQKGLAGLDAQNIVNRCLKKGVQLEISHKLRNELKNSPKLLKFFAETIRKDLQN